MKRTSTVQGISALTGTAVEITISDGAITGVRETARPDRPLPFVAPGFIDIQVNGYSGIDYSSPELTARDVGRVVGFLEASGTTTHLPTVITSPQDTILRSIRTICTALDDSPQADAIAGVHVEGPYISEADGPRGAHDARYARDPNVAEYEEWQDAARGNVKIVTLAPERNGALEFIERIARDGVVPAIGHTAASPERIVEAVQAGARLSTHLGNGSPRTVHRLHNHIWEQLGQDALCASIIADGFHLPPAVIRVFARAKGAERVVLVSDVGALAGFEPGVYDWGSLRIRVHPDGHLQMDGTEFLAGAGHLLNRCVAQYCRHGAATLADSVRACTTTPARLLSLADRMKGIVPGARADLVQFRLEPQDQTAEIVSVVRSGSVVHGTPA